MLLSWAGVVASLVVAGEWDQFAVRWRGRERLEHLRRSGTATAAAAAALPPAASGSSSSMAAGLGPPHPQRPYPSLQAWVRRQAQGMSEGQRTFERAAQLRAAEIRRGVLFTYTELPWCARTYLTSAALGEEYWNDIEVVRLYMSPLHAICVLSGRAGGRAARDARRQEEDRQHVARGSLLPWRLAGPSDAAPAPLLLSAAAPLTREVALQQAQAEGLTLLVAKGKTGYFGVVGKPGRPKPYHGQVSRSGKDVYLGSFATAEEAALCVARTPEGQKTATRRAKKDGGAKRPRH